MADQTASAAAPGSEALRAFLRDSGQPLEPSAGTYGAGDPRRWSHDPTARSAELDEIVDRVVRRIEERVVDELERRGRRHHGGAF